MAAPADRAENGAQRGVEIAEEILLWRFAVARRLVGMHDERRGIVPGLVRDAARLREEQRDDEQQAPEHLHFARHSSRPAMKMSFGRFLPMNTRIDSLLSCFAHGLPMSPPIIMCTPWNTTRRGL